MSAQPEDHQMEGVDQPIADKGKGKAADVPEESAEEESSDESGAEGEVRANCILQPQAQTANAVATGRRGYATFQP
jgi:hypothetical protein